VLWAAKGQGGGPSTTSSSPRACTKSEWSHRPFGKADRHSVFTPERVSIETDDGTVVEALEQPRGLVRRIHARDALEHAPTRVLRRHGDVDVPDATVHVSRSPDSQTTELEPWDEAGQRWRRLRVTWPSYLATRSTEQTLYFNRRRPAGTPRLRRRDQRRQSRRPLRLRLHRGRGHQAPHQPPDLPAHPRRRGRSPSPLFRLDRSQRDRVHLGRRNHMSTHSNQPKTRPRPRLIPAASWRPRTVRSKSTGQTLVRAPDRPRAGEPGPSRSCGARTARSRPRRRRSSS